MKALVPYMEHQYKVEQIRDYLREADQHRCLGVLVKQSDNYIHMALSAVGKALVRFGYQLQGHDAARSLTASVQREAN